MKRNLNSLTQLIKKFHNRKKIGLSILEVFRILDEILFFEKKTKSLPLFNSQKLTHELTMARTSEIRTASRTYQAGSIFIRARKIEAVLSTATEQDFWEPPPDFTKKLRLNQAGEAVLYLTSNLITALKETRISENDIYNLNFYRADVAIDVTEVGYKTAGKRSAIRKSIENFFHKIFITRDENVYEISNFIAKRYFSLATDGWVYPSIANNHKGDNICINIKSKPKLILIGSFAFRNSTPISKYDFTDLNNIKNSKPDQAIAQWNSFIKKYRIFGDINEIQDPNPEFMIKQIAKL